MSWTPQKLIYAYPVLLVKNFGPCAFGLVCAIVLQCCNFLFDFFQWFAFLGQLLHGLDSIYGAVLRQQPNKGVSFAPTEWSGYRSGDLPSGRFRQDWPEDRQDESRNELKTNWYLPARIAFNGLRSEIYQRGDNLAEDNHELYGGIHHASKLTRAGLGEVDRYDNDGQASGCKIQATTQGELCCRRS